MKPLTANQRTMLSTAEFLHDGIVMPLADKPKVVSYNTASALHAADYLERDIVPDDVDGFVSSSKTNPRAGYRITAAGRQAIGLDPEPAAPPAPPTPEPTPEPTPVTTAPIRALRPIDRLRQAAERMLRALDEGAAPSEYEDARGELRAALAAMTATKVPGRQRTTTPRAPRTSAPKAGTKQDMVLAMLRRPHGATGPEIQAAAGWLPHTVRGFISILGKSHHIVRTKLTPAESAISVTRYHVTDQAAPADGRQEDEQGTA